MSGTPGKVTGINRESRAFLRTQQLANTKHDVAGVGSTFRLLPQRQLFREVGTGLPCQRRVGGPHALALRAVAIRAGRNPAFRVAIVIERHREFVDRRKGRHLGCLHSREIGRDRAPLPIVQLARDVLHLGIAAPAVGIGDQLPLEVPRVDPRKPGSHGAIAFASHTMAGDARVLRTGASAAQSDKFARRGKSLGRFHRSRAAPSKGKEGESEECDPLHRTAIRSPPRPGREWTARRRQPAQPPNTPDPVQQRSA